jgi:YggT family protein
MTSDQQPLAGEPPPPQRGLRRDERGRDVSAAQAEVEAETSKWKRFQLLFYVTVYPLLWLLFWPVRAHQKRHHPEEYAANRAKYAKTN